LNVNPLHTASVPLTTGLVNAGLIRITNVAGQVVPTPPGGNTNSPDVVFTAAGNITISLATTNIPAGTSLTVRVTAAGQVISVQPWSLLPGGAQRIPAELPPSTI